ncbi:MAG: tRNA uridine-5-carboxymethylaminomethyl(34) synthesis GTPase MnmE [Halanaerobiaceae bacterium]|nr:tRNA uridine-5-carboxymethylaminomethyl(34) synthesis GTPase MnmE [Halanaerobiaceae bacterium]
MYNDTIAAISTPYGTAGIGKIRVSGSEAIDLVAGIFKGVQDKDLRQQKGYTAHYGHIMDPETGKIADEVICIVFREPHSFTGENMVEIDCHGGLLPLQRVLEIVLKRGARLAEPGEFSKRAFLNGRIDLAQAEGIMEVINARTNKGLDLALSHLEGKLSRKIAGLKDALIGLYAHLEAAIDYAEDEVEDLDPDELEGSIKEIKGELEKLLATSEQGKIYREGLKTVIAGKPNVGKSSLMNALLEENRAIVTDIPGTTRDIIEEYINIEGIPLRIIDTAGIRETEDLVEKIGVERTEQYLQEADLVLLMLDVVQGLTEEDLRIYQLASEKPLIVLINKIDLAPERDYREIEERFPEHSIIRVSVQEEQGLEELKKAIVEVVLGEGITGDEEIYITRTRHKNALVKAVQAMDRVIDTHRQGLPYDLYSIDLRDALDALGEITGETLTEDIIDRIFQDFCLGK